MKKLVVAYRDNDLFHKYVPLILEHVPPDVEVVHKTVFPPGTDVEEIKREILQLFKSIDAPFWYLRDKTCEIFGIPYPRIKCLDLSWAFSAIVLEMFSSRSFSDILKRIALLINKSPELVCIVEQRITDHLYGFSDARELNATCNEKGFTDLICESIKEICPGVAVCRAASLASAISECGDNESAILIADRHCGIYGIMDSWDITTWKHKAKLFLLPFENAVSHLITLGKIQEEFDPKILAAKLFENF